jgi:DNA (cytosine-5)-methyltransferase 1
LAGWPDDKPVWTGSCPCQPFSQAGKGRGLTDERHLWPAFYHLIRIGRPAVVFGEQVASPAGLGWWDLVSADLEASHYAVGAVDTCAASVGAPHVRQRLYWVAHANSERRTGQRLLLRTEEAGRVTGDILEAARGSEAGELADAHDAGSQGRHERRDGAAERFTWPSGVAVDWIPCRDGKSRPVESGTFPLAHGIPSRVGRLRAYGNAIVPQVAAAFIEASGL